MARRKLNKTIKNKKNINITLQNAWKYKTSILIGAVIVVVGGIFTQNLIMDVVAKLFGTSTSEKLTHLTEPIPPAPTPSTHQHHQPTPKPLNILK